MNGIIEGGAVTGSSPRSMTATDLPHVLAEAQTTANARPEPLDSPAPAPSGGLVDRDVLDLDLRGTRGVEAIDPVVDHRAQQQQDLPDDV